MDTYNWTIPISNSLCRKIKILLLLSIGKNSTLVSLGT